MKGLIFSVKRYAIHDGPGIRVSFFMKGCPLTCWWCHNPEGLSPETEEITQINRVGESEFSRCVVVGKYYSVKEITAIVDKERVFIEQSNGGVTFSGGEPMLQADFLQEALSECMINGYHTAIDTSGFFPASSLGKVLPFTNLFLFDLKHLDDEKHKEYTGVSNKSILDNLVRIIGSGTETRLRIPVIPGLNDDLVHLKKMRKYINSVKSRNVSLINLLPFHKIGMSKYRKFGRPYKMEAFSQPSQNRMEELKEFFSETGIKVKIGG